MGSEYASSQVINMSEQEVTMLSIWPTERRTGTF